MSRKRSARFPVRDEKQVELGLNASPEWVIYVLCDPRMSDPIQRIRYAGVTRRKPEIRLQAHMGSARRGENTHKARWIRQLLANGMTPVMEIIDPASAGRGWEKNEQAWIRHFRAIGCSLTNLTDGGDGAPGHAVSAETRAKLSAASRNRSPEQRERHAQSVRDPQTKAKVAEANRNRSAETRAKLAEACRNRSPETKARVAESMRKRMADPETRARVGEASRGRVASPEARKNMSKSHRGHPISPETRAKISEAKRAQRKAGEE